MDDIAKLPAEFATPKLHRFGKKTLAHVGSPSRGANIWRDVTTSLAFLSSKYQPHQGKRECARRLQQAV